MSKKLGVALSGGGYRGVAQVGALQYMEELGLEFSVVAGTSAGAIVGALYAAGNSPEKILRVFQETELFEFSYFHWRGPGLLDTPQFKEYLTPHLQDDNFDGLSRKLYIIAADLIKGEEVVIDRGPLTQAILASAAFPGIFAPVKVSDQVLVDGGIFNNLPTDIVREHADKVVALDVNPIDKVGHDEVGNTFQVIKRAIELSTRMQSLRKQEYADVYISPKEAVKFPMFAQENAEKLFNIGYEEAKKHQEELEKLL